jgi:predicted RNA-binding protein YlxR (DUF448 family)
MPETELLRFVLSPTGEVTPDIKRKLPGRGVWIEARRAVIEQAMQRKHFARAFRQAASVPEDLAVLVEKLLHKEALSRLSLANKAGLVLTGYEKIRDAINKGLIGWLLHASDASENGSLKLDRRLTPDLAQTTASFSGVLPSLFTAEELSLALGRGNVVHIGLKRGEAARRFQDALIKAAHYKEERPPETPIPA